MRDAGRTGDADYPWEQDGHAVVAEDPAVPTVLKIVK